LTNAKPTDFNVLSQTMIPNCWLLLSLLLRLHDILFELELLSEVVVLVTSHLVTLVNNICEGLYDVGQTPRVPSLSVLIMRIAIVVVANKAATSKGLAA
jgi:hypothetical protein